MSSALRFKRRLTWTDVRVRPLAARARLLAGLIVLAATSVPAYAQTPTPAATRSLLDVPYLTQTPELCGGAALAMVLRYWGDQDVFAEDFSPLVDKRAAGIATDALTKAAQARGSGAAASHANAGSPMAALRSAIDRGHPVIALIDPGGPTGQAPKLFHYVVVVGLTDDAVVYHDPAQAPYRVVAGGAFDRAWAVTNRWMLVIERPTLALETQRELRTARPTDTPGGGACAALVTHSVSRAQAKDLDTAERGLWTATRLCPLDGAPWRELAGLRFLSSQWDDARHMATTAVTLAPSDEHAWQVLATSEFLLGHSREALRAWNRVGAPRTDAVTVTGAVRTRWPVVTDAMGLRPRDVLTPEMFTRASRRLAALPAASATTLRFEPTPDGRAVIEAVIVERPLMPSGLVPLVAIGARALVLDEVRLTVAGPTGSGELWSGTWNWSDPRPRLALQLDLPSPVRLHRGLVGVGVVWERETYTSTRVDRRAVAVRVSDWAPRELHWQAVVSYDRVDRQPFVAVDAGLDKRAFGDRVAVRAGAGWWMPAGAGASFHTRRLSMAWRSGTAPDQISWSGVMGMAAASAHAPSIEWPGAGTGQIRATLLRAHPLAESGVITGAAFGRRLVHASMELERPLLRRTAGRVSGAVFVDAARAWHRMEPSATGRLHVDIGAGVRIHARGMDGGVRIDVAYGIRDSRRAVSLAWTAAWPQ